MLLPTSFQNIIKTRPENLIFPTFYRPAFKPVNGQRLHNGLTERATYHRREVEAQSTDDQGA